jgi:hypothetical protein
MVNGTFLLRPMWENFAGSTWSMNRYCRPLNAGILSQIIESNHLLAMARLSLFSS